MSNPPTPAELEATREFYVGIRDDLRVLSDTAAANTPKTRVLR